MSLPLAANKKETFEGKYLTELHINQNSLLLGTGVLPEL